MRPRHVIFIVFMALACLIWAWGFRTVNPELPIFLRLMLALLFTCLAGLILVGMYLLVSGLWRAAERIEINVATWLREREIDRKYRGRQ